MARKGAPPDDLKTVLTAGLVSPHEAAEILLGALRANASPSSVQGMVRYGISAQGTLGVSMPVLRALARTTRRAFREDLHARHDIARQLWSSAVHEARILAALADVPTLLNAEQMERWAADFDSWDVCDQVCGNLFDKSPLAWKKAGEWAAREPEFVKRAGFVLMAQLAVHDKPAPDERFETFLRLVSRGAEDERAYVKKAVNWALRQIGKRNLQLNAQSIEVAEGLLVRYPDSSSARWVARDALRELKSDAVHARLSGGRNHVDSRDCAQ